MNAAPKPLAKSLRREQMAWRAAQDLPDGGLVNLGIGIPVLTSDYIPAGREVVLQSENGVIGVGPLAAPEAADPDLVDAGSRRITLGRGATIVDSAASFAMIRRGPRSEERRAGKAGGSKRRFRWSPEHSKK